jgi:hypothetical protein
MKKNSRPMLKLLSTLAIPCKNAEITYYPSSLNCCFSSAFTIWPFVWYFKLSFLGVANDMMHIVFFHFLLMMVIILVRSSTIPLKWERCITLSNEHKENCTSHSEYSITNKKTKKPIPKQNWQRNWTRPFFLVISWYWLADILYWIKG